MYMYLCECVCVCVCVYVNTCESHTPGERGQCEQLRRGGPRPQHVLSGVGVRLCLAIPVVGLHRHRTLERGRGALSLPITEMELS